ncbi:MAG: toprim domain-containing protein [Candidatus Altiarchaeales archaeon]|nr:toprim domain-containing protein [Candidatus Altiarchaeales archaeon]
MKISPEIVAHIKDLVDPETLLSYLGFKIVKRGYKELRGPCKVHGGDNITAFRFNMETRTWCCYTRHCEGETDRDIIGLVKKTQGLSFPEAVKFLSDLTGVSLEDTEEVSEKYLELQRRREIQREIRQSKIDSSPVTSFLPQEIVDQNLPRRSGYFEERGFPPELLDFYEVGGFPDRKGVHREAIPIRDEYGNLLTISGRRTDSDEDPKYLLMKDIDKGAVLYNLDVAQNYVGNIEAGQERTLILVEGFVDVWGFAKHDVYNVVAAMGTDITSKQRDLLCKYAENVKVVMDPDDAGRAGAERIQKMLEKYVNVEVISLPEGKDPKNFNSFAEVQKYIGVE